MKLPLNKITNQNFGFTLIRKNLASVHAFTLIELLIVIVIIGILSTFTIANLNGSQKRARDTQRKSDLNQYRTALENYAVPTGGKYPSITTLQNTLEAAPNGICARLGTNLASCPTDPKNSEPNLYKYQSNGSGGNNNDATNYILYGFLEADNTYWFVCADGRLGSSAIKPTLVKNCN